MKICITGKPCSGKTLAINFIKKTNHNVWIADEFVNKIYKYNKIGYKLILKHFGSSYVHRNEVNKKALGKLVFNKKNELDKLNHLINPLIKKEIKNLNPSKDWFVELGTYIYYPSFFKNLFQKIILIYRNNLSKNNEQNKRFFYLKNIPTFFVDKYEKQNKSILYIGNKFCSANQINVDIFVDNSFSKEELQKNILKIFTKIF